MKAGVPLLFLAMKQTAARTECVFGQGKAAGSCRLLQSSTGYYVNTPIGKSGLPAMQPFERSGLNSHLPLCSSDLVQTNDQGLFHGASLESFVPITGHTTQLHSQSCVLVQLRSDHSPCPSPAESSLCLQTPPAGVNTGCFTQYVQLSEPEAVCVTCL